MLRLLLVPKGESQIDWKRNKNGRNQFCAAFRVRSFSGTSTALLLCMMQLQMLVMPALLLMGLSVHGLLIPLQQHPPPPAPPHSKRRHILLAMSGQEEAISASAADNDSSTGTLSLRKKTARIRNNNETTGTRSSSRQTTERIRNDGTPNTADASGTTPVFQSPRTPPPPPSAVALQQSSTSSALLQPENGVKVSASSPSSSLLSEQLQQLKDSVDIVTAIESYQLDGFKRTGGGGGSGGGSRSRSGNNHNRAVAVCPFHDDHNPSLSIDSSRQIYKCFSCGAGGDVFRFVQEYSKLPGHGPELTFGQAVQHISTAFGDGRTSILGSAMSSSSKSSYSPARMEEQQRLQRKKDRMLLANAAAAAFFADCLTEPIAGGARYHLRSRQLSVLSIRAFAMGYAPDAYLFGAQKSRSKHNDWGEGSLVHHLRDLGFTPTEILDAGLATRTKKLSQPAGQKRTTNGAVSRETKDSTTDESATFADDPDTTNYSTLMDRFRARIMVPIFDASGSNILGFGGRVLPPPEMDVIEVVDGKMSDSNSNFKAPKYLNSPESQVFEKKNILFGQHVAQQTIREANSNSATTTTTSSALLVVEGYMDAIALWDAGIGNVVASMGTAVTAEQLELAAQTAGTRGGRIVLCLDNDTAGVTAMERLCKNGMLAECVTKHVVAIAVARLPDGVKDPAEFIESRKSSGADMTQVANDFRREVIDCAVDWTEWFIQRIIREYNREAPRGANGSFSDIFERIADFLASSLRPADRTKRAYEVAGLLSDILARERNTTEISGAVRIQLESDLIDLASRLSDAKGAIQRRIESVANGPSSTGTSASSALSALTRGHGPNSPDQVDKLSVRGRTTIALESGKGSSRTGSAKRSHPEVPASPKASVRVQIKKPTRAKMTRQLDVESLTPHFSGFRFTHQFDSDWLGLSKSEKVCRKMMFVLPSA